ncbi:hypothetical protein L9F63_025399, partial [Diploptera punctata]
SIRNNTTSIEAICSTSPPEYKTEKSGECGICSSFLGPRRELRNNTTSIEAICSTSPPEYKTEKAGVRGKTSAYITKVMKCDKVRRILDNSDENKILPGQMESPIDDLIILGSKRDARTAVGLRRSPQEGPAGRWHLHGKDSNPDMSIREKGIPFTHIASPMPEVYRKSSIVPRGVANRRAALNWIRRNAKNGVLYFGDDDNTFDLKLFEEIRDTKKVSMFPVGLIGDYAVSSPVLKEGKVVGFFDSWPSKRKFAVDMAGFAVNIEYLISKQNATMPYKAGYEEDQFLRSLGLQLEDIEPKANLCTQVLVWHTQTTKKSSPTIRIETNIVDTSLKSLLDEIEALGMGHVSSTTGVKSYITKDGKTKAL